MSNGTNVERGRSGNYRLPMKVAAKTLLYGDALTYYTWTVTAAGVATGLYWGPGASPQTDPATQQIGPLRWVRGARNCSY